MRLRTLVVICLKEAVSIVVGHWDGEKREACPILCEHYIERGTTGMHKRRSPNIKKQISIATFILALLLLTVSVPVVAASTNGEFQSSTRIL